MKERAKIVLMGNYEIMAYDYRLIQHKEPAIISSGITSNAHIQQAHDVLNDESLDSEKFFTNVFPVSQFELAYRMALDSKESIKTVLSWV